MQVMHAFYIDEEATAILVRALDMSISQAALEAFFSRDDARSSCAGGSICQPLLQGEDEGGISYS